MKVKWKCYCSALIVVGATTGAGAAVVTYDLAADWSLIQNPNGAWAYGEIRTGGFEAFQVKSASYINVGPQAFSSPQPAWTRCIGTGNNGCPEGLTKGSGNSLLDLPVGRVGGHTPVNGALAVRWQAPSDGVIDIAGDVWLWQDLGRVLTTSLSLNGSSIFASVRIPTRASGITSANPYTFVQALLDSGSSSAALTGIAVHAGDQLMWSARQATGSVEWFTGIDLGIRFTPAAGPAPQPAPEPGTPALAAVGLLLAWWARRGLG